MAIKKLKQAPACETARTFSLGWALAIKLEIVSNTRFCTSFDLHHHIEQKNRCKELEG